MGVALDNCSYRCFTKMTLVQEDVFLLLGRLTRLVFAIKSMQQFNLKERSYESL